MSDQSLRAARWLLVIVSFLLVYGSLFPFRFADPGAADLADLLGRLGWARTTRSDVAANVLLYLPFGACLGWMLAGRLGGPLAALLTVAAGMLLSTAIEIAQIFETRRVASLADVLFNALGSLAGAGIALALRSARQGLRRHRFGRLLAHPFAASLLVLWAGYRLAPFAVTLDPAEWLAAVAPLARGPWLSAPGAVLRFLLPWLIVAQALASLVRGERALPALAACMLGMLAALVLVSGKALEPAELVAMGIALPLAAVLGAVDQRRGSFALAIALAAAIVASGLAPFDFASEPVGFGLIPFEEPLVRYRAANLGEMFQKCFGYGALVWLLVRSGRRPAAATFLAGGLVLVVEVLQIWLPGQAAEITDPLLVLAAGGLLAIFEDDRAGPRFARH